MSKLGKIILIISIVLCTIVPPFQVKAAGSYSVEMVSNTSGNKVVGTYTTYNEAVNVMNAQNSTSTSVASIYKDGKIINSRYAIFQFYPNGGTINLYQSIGGSAYTYIRPSSMTDAAFIDSTENQALIMYEGFKGYVDINAGNIIPISLISSNMIQMSVSLLNLRESPNTSAKSLAKITCTNCTFAYDSKTTGQGYTWYRISYNGQVGWVASDNWATEINGTGLNTFYYRYSSGNLLHRYAYHNGTSYSDDFYNLGPTPSYLSVGVNYYSFDGGIYLYNSVQAMLDDYRNDSYTSSINANNPNYPYYLFMPSKSVSKASAADLNAQITNPNSKLYNQGANFKEVERLYGMNALTAFAKARTESGDGMSSIAQNKNNLFGYGAADSCAYDCAKSYASVYDSIVDYARSVQGSYTTAGAKYYFGSHPGTKGSGRNVKYASNAGAGELEAASAFMADLKNNGLRDYKSNTIGVTKYGKYNVPVYKEANTNTVIYNMQNINSSFRVYNVPVNVVDKVGDFYKIYTDSNDYQYGYIKVSDLNVSNNQPVINASDRTIALNSSFNYMNDISANDAEDGNLTGRVTYSGNVNTAKSGTYPVTYTVTDNSNFSMSKTINIIVKGSSEPVINANNKEVSQYTTFNYMDGVTATDDTDGDLTNKITYTDTVDTKTKGTYDVTYTVTNSNNKTTTKTIKVTVIDNSKPVINATNKTVYLNKEFNPLEGVTASDKEDGEITSKVKVVTNEVKTDVIGDYKVVYSVTDSANQTTTKEIMVTVSEKVLKETTGEFYFDYLKNVNGMLQLKGYNTINGIDNDLSTDIKYKLQFKNLDTGVITTQDAIRIINMNEIERPAFGNDNKDYTFSWFKIDIDLNSLPEGNYSMLIVSENEEYFSKSVISNKLFKEQVTGFDGDKYAIISNNYSVDDAPVEMIVRKEKIASKNADYTYNQFDQYRTFEFTEEGILNVLGNSYSYGGDYSAGRIVERKIIFENIKNYQKFTKNLGSITNGLYNVALPVPDGLDKTRAWYSARIDISDIPPGKYAIYIATSSNINDVAEFKELLNRSLEHVKRKIGDNTYSFNVNTNNGNRIEMIVE